MITKIAFPVFSQLTTYETNHAVFVVLCPTAGSGLRGPMGRLAPGPRLVIGEAQWLSTNLNVWTVALLRAGKAPPAVCPLSKVGNYSAVA
jgi:hypothetical protein